MRQGIITDRLVILPIPPVKYCAQLMAGWLNEPRNVKYSGQRHIKHTTVTQKAYIRSFSGTTSILRGLFVKESQHLIGSVTAYFDDCNGLANVGIMVGDPAFWGQAYGHEGWKGFCDSLFQQGVRKIEAGCMAENRAMMAVCRHYRMVEEGRQINHFQINDQLSDLVHWGRFK